MFTTQFFSDTKIWITVTSYVPTAVKWLEYVQILSDDNMKGFS